MKKIELLAPAGSELAFRAAIENGADAVYLGTEEFSARHFAENFKLDNLENVVTEGHKRGVKVYLTVNTLLNSEEINKYPEYLYKAAQSGIDGLIVQDLGVINLTRALLPELPLHGSTQMTINNSAGVEYLKTLGFKRVVLARETRISDVELIRSKTDVELEIFAHGALCVSYSGVCYFSSMLGGRSGNRGKCAQPCRLEYKLMKDGSLKELNKRDENHLLSTKDLRMIESLPEIIESGVASIKIEGRMKRPEYVAVVIDHYRNAIDSYYKDPKNFSVDSKVLHELEQSFSRGSGKGHYFDKLSYDGMSWMKPNNAGTEVGKVISYKSGKALIKLFEDVNKGDGYVIDSYDGEQAGGIKEVAKKGETMELPLKGRVRIGEILYKTRDQLLQRRAKDTFSSSRITNRKYIEVKAILREGEPLHYEIKNEKGHIIQGKGQVLLEKAINRPLTEEKILEQFSRLGNTPFEISDFTADIEGDLIVPVSELNHIRKEFVQRLEEEKLDEFQAIQLPQYKEYLSAKPKLNSREGKFKKKLSVSVSSLEALESALAGGADIIYLYIESLRNVPKIALKDIKEAINLTEGKCELIFILPSIIKETQSDYYRKLSNEIENVGGKSFSIANLSGFSYLKDSNTDISGEFTLNIFNSYALHFLEKEGLKRVTLSPELSLNQINTLGDSLIEKEAIIQGNFPLITTEYCVLESSDNCMKKNKDSKDDCSKNLHFKDRKSYKLPLAFDYDCKMYLYNAKEISLYRDLDKVFAGKIDILRIEGRNDSSENILEKTKMYKEQMDLYNNDKKIKITKENIDKIAALSPCGLTAGHFFRGVE